MGDDQQEEEEEESDNEMSRGEQGSGRINREQKNKSYRQYFEEERG